MKRFLLYFSLLALISASCTPTYLPNAYNSPLLGHKGEIAGSAQASLNGYNFQAAYAITDHVGVMLNNQFKLGTIDRSNSDTAGTITSREEPFRQIFLEAGAGYFLTMGKIGRFGIWGGFGYGQTKTLDYFFPFKSISDYTYIKSPYFRSFIQPEIGLKTKVFDFSFTPRFTFVNFMEMKNVSTNTSFNPAFNSMFFEPGTTIRLGYNWVKFTTSGGLAIRLYNSPNSNPNFAFQPFIWTVGLQFNIGGFK